MLVLGLSGAVTADVYSYTDADGVIHFTNKKPTGGAAWKKVLISEPEKGSKASAPRGSCERCDKVGASDFSPERFHRYDAYILEASELYRIPVPERMAGRRVLEVAASLLQFNDATLLAVARNGSVLANPGAQFMLESGDEMVLMAESMERLASLSDAATPQT